MTRSHQKGYDDDFLARFWSRVKKTDGCWEWQGCRMPPMSYGQIGVPGRKTRLTHRVSWQIHFGDIPEGSLVCHRCDNPPCVRPDHLFLGGHLENNRDMFAKGRNKTNFGTKHPQAKLSDEEVRQIRNRIKFGEDFKTVAAEFGITPQYASQLARRKWRKSA